MARATGRAEHQPVHVTSALKKGPRATSAEPAETSRRSETSAEVPDEPEPAGPRDKRAQERTQSNQRGTSRNQPAERDQWGELPDEPGASGFA